MNPSEPLTAQHWSDVISLPAPKPNAWISFLAHLLFILAAWTMFIKYPITCRQSLTLIGAAFAAMMLPTASFFANTGGMRQKTFAGTDKKLPVIGMGTWRTFNVGNDPELLDARTEVVQAFFEHGGGLIDSSLMYGSAPPTTAKPNDGH